ncbi:phage portal protein [Paradevosia shaoguanensis]|uniref:Phage portal protein n=1 Tax=Paradevosia shaoguanensis TaxID=1335043 RepID=A0AA41QJT4_9HYPH|nr:phage portal protein [Paradevosia shaoguanensis]MCF1741743.1 phage portal protein [Paradevosia shaoguanensis]MCI0126226.1 phage portal protein [Paradevosia shaoguanensis]
MANWLTRLAGGRLNAPAERKSSGPQALFSLAQLGEANWTKRGFVSLANEGFAKNPVVYRCVRMVAEAANSVPLVVEENGRRTSDHPVVTLLRRPNPRQSGSELLEAVYAYLQTAGNAYLEAAIVEGQVRGLFCLRPDRMKVVAGKDGWPAAYAYSVGERTRQLSQEPAPVPKVLHMALFHPLDDHYGMAPLEAAQQSLDIHNASAQWNKSLLDNAARPSGALVYSMGEGNLSPDQFDRLKTELEEHFAGAMNAGRPMVLEGGLDWKTIALSPRDMDFIEARHGAARDIALAFGVPPMLLGLPGDNTYSNMVEANRALWRQTVMPLVRRVADDLSYWLAPAFGGATLVPDFDAVEALAEDRAAMWERVGAASFLSDEEKRGLLGV